LRTLNLENPLNLLNLYIDHDQIDNYQISRPRAARRPFQVST
jgi:hypothetical protein